MKRSILLLLLCFIFPFAKAINIERFEHLDTRNGLSQNSVLSIYCDKKGFMWFGTMDGLNRFDGYSFKIYKALPGENNVLTNNRIIGIWEDDRNFLWVKTHDGYLHYLDESTDKFTTFPRYQESDEEKNSEITGFCQFSKDEIWLSGSNSGIYKLLYDSTINDYRVEHFLSRGVNHITNNKAGLLFKDSNNDLWIGTSQGLNLLSLRDNVSGSYTFQHFFVDSHITSAAQIGQRVYFGTVKKGLIVYDLDKKDFSEIRESRYGLSCDEINVLKAGNDGKLIIGTGNSGINIYDPKTGIFTSYMSDNPVITSIFEDRSGKLWVNTNRFGITKIDPLSGKSKYFALTPQEIVPLVDNERQYIFQDKSGRLWIGLHGAGLALYDPEHEIFNFFRNNPDDPNTISSNFVHCITEDKSGLLWAGTGQFNGGINKIIFTNPSFRQVFPKKKIDDKSENVIRSILEDKSGIIWTATKNGKLYIYDSDLNLKTSFEKLSIIKEDLQGFNVYCMMQDSKGFLWLGSKGGGISVSTKPLDRYKKNYGDIRFFHYVNIPGDTESLSSNFIYSINEDKKNRIWIGTYGGGLVLVKNQTPDKLTCTVFNQSNTNLSSNEIRQVFLDSKGRFWLATTFGLDLMRGSFESRDSAIFDSFNYNPADTNTISYNDVIHIFEDSRNNLWFGTFGGGVNLLKSDADAFRFTHYNTQKGLINDAVFGILEDDDGYLWFSTENGISRFNLTNEVFENYDKDNGLVSSNFSENTCIKTHKGILIFGTINGVLVISPEKIVKSEYDPPIVLTNFQLNNKDVNISDINSPVRKNIEFLDEIVLEYNQNSFSIEYAALSYFDPLKNKYLFKLEGFEDSWNDIGNQRKATYTNIPPGSYIFQVKAANWDGTWNQNPRMLKIRVLPPIWRTAFAYAIYALILILLIDIARRIFTRYNHMRNDLRVERRINEIKLQFFTNISHEIRTPLTLILGPLEDLMKAKDLPDTVVKPLEVINRNGKKMLGLINQLLDFRKIQNNKMKLKIQETDIVKFCGEIFENFEYLARQRKIDYSFRSGLESCKLWIDYEKLDIVLFNLLSNAFKFTPEGKKIELGISIPTDTGFVEITVFDEGKGIAHDKIPLLFERYNSLSFDAKGFSGTGIGLSLSRELVRLHKGEITVKSEPGKGSIFTIRIPTGVKHFEPEQLIEAENSSIVRHIMTGQEIILPEDFEPPDTAKEKKKEYKLLIIEDNPDILNYISRSLNREFNILTATNGQEGLDIIPEFQPDLVITDIMMPVMDGIEFTNKVKENFETSHIPVVMLTAKSGINDQIDGFESGAEAYVLKPFNSRYLKAVVFSLIKQRQLLSERLVTRKDISPGKIKITTKDEEFLAKLLKIIDDNYSDPEFNVEKMVDVSNFGRTVFYNKIKGLTGLSPVEFLRQMRLKIASQLLESSDYNISEIAYMTGFNDDKYFRRCFRTLYGATPTEYRKNKNRG
jgi:signal transduction histidine kinase/ligand-binding sensor domain-containing protein/DNA-binding NarL/FixJ family response regulator